MSEAQIDSPGGPLDDDEVRQLGTLLARYASNHLDQWEGWQVATGYGQVYVMLMNKLPDGSDADAFMPIWPWSPPGTRQS